MKTWSSTAHSQHFQLPLWRTRHGPGRFT